MLNPDRKANRSRSRVIWWRAFAGVVAGVSFALGGSLLGLDAIPPFHWVQRPVLAAIAGAALGFLPGRWTPALLATLGSLPWLGLLVVIATPVMGPLDRALVRADALRPAAAIVVLSSDIRPDGTPDRGMQWRLDHAYDLVRAGYSRRLAVPRLAVRDRSYLPAIRQQLSARGLRCEVEEIGLVRNTHDEVLRIGDLEKRSVRRPLILVSEALHLRRVTALCRKAGVTVMRSPSGYAEFDYRRPRNARERLAAFRVWLLEVYLYENGRWHGWL